MNAEIWHIANSLFLKWVHLYDKFSLDYLFDDFPLLRGQALRGVEKLATTLACYVEKLSRNANRKVSTAKWIRGRRKIEVKNSEEKILIFFNNPDGLTREKQLALNDFVDSGRINLFALVETYVRLHELLFTPSGFSSSHLPRQLGLKKGEGTALMANASVSYHRLYAARADELAYSKIGWFKVLNIIWSLNVVIVYLAAGSRKTDTEMNDRLWKVLYDIVDQIPSKKEAILILGDFNGRILVHGPLVPEMEELRDCRKITGKSLSEFAASQELRVLNRDVVCTGTWTWSRKNRKSVLDYVLANEALYPYVSNVTIHDSGDVTTGSDYNPITVELRITLDQKVKVQKRQTGWKVTAAGLKIFSNMVEENTSFERNWPNFRPPFLWNASDHRCS